MKSLIVIVTLALAAATLLAINWACLGYIVEGLYVNAVGSYALTCALTLGYIGLLHGYIYWDEHRDGWV